MSVISLVAVIWLGSLFVYSGLLKLIDLKESVLGVVRYHILPRQLSIAVGRVLPIVELAVAVLLLVPSAQKIGAIGAGILGLAFSYATASALKRRVDVSCGCVGRASGPVNAAATGRAAVIAASGIAVAIQNQAVILPVWLAALLVVTASAPAAVLLGRRRTRPWVDLSVLRAGPQEGD